MDQYRDHFGDRIHRRRARTRFILIGLLIAGPCCALFTAQRSRAAQVGVVAVLLALVLALAEGIWDTPARLILTAAVVMVAVACTWAAGIIGSMTRP